MILVVRVDNGSAKRSVSAEETVEKRRVILSPKGEGSALLQFPYAPRHVEQDSDYVTSCDGARPSCGGAILCLRLRMTRDGSCAWAQQICRTASFFPLKSHHFDQHSGNSSAQQRSQHRNGRVAPIGRAFAGDGQNRVGD